MQYDGFLMKTFEVLIEEYNPKGDGIAKQVIVPGSIKGETVQATRIKKKTARLDTVIAPSDHRVISPCKHDAECGGCRWGHIHYPQQIQEKQAICASLFCKFPLKPIIPATHLWEFRHKMEFSFSQNRLEKRFFGLYDPITKRVNTLTTCKIATPFTSNLLKKVMQWWESTSLEAYYHPTNSGALQTLTVRTCRRTPHKMVCLQCSLHPDFLITKEQQQSFVKAIDPCEHTSVFLLLKRIKKGVPTQIFEHKLHGPEAMIEHIPHPLLPEITLRFTISPQSFFQPNLYQVDHLLRLALSLAKIQSTDNVCDLYCGVGLIGLAASFLCKKVYACEISSSSAVDIQENIRLMQRDNVVFEKKDAESFLGSITEKINVLFVDPPRCGLGASMIKTLVPKQIEKICYISCNPHTQYEDVVLLQEEGYIVSIVQPLDQFPHTPHIENIIILERKPSAT